MALELGVDFSQWGGQLKEDTVKAWMDEGTKFAILQYSALTRQHLSVIDPFDIDISIYTYLYWGQSPWGQTPQERVRNTIELINGSRISVIHLDAEDREHPYRENQLKECELIAVESGYTPYIYTGKWWWIPETKNSTAFSHLNLWDAYYLSENPIPDFSKMPVDFDNWKPYSGWTKPAIWQWHNTTTFCKHSVDLNVREPKVELMRIEHQSPNLFLSQNAFNGGADWVGIQGVNAQVDFGIPPEAKYIEVEFLARNGFAIIKSGATDIEVGQVGWGANKGPAREVCIIGLGDNDNTGQNPTPGRWFSIVANEITNPIYFYHVRSIAYYK